MKYCIFDLMNLIKRYIPYLDTDEIDNETSCNIMNKILKIINVNNYDIAIICCDLGKNKRAIAITKGAYKANRNGRGRNTEFDDNFIVHTKKLLKTLPIPFIEVEDTEADFIIYLLSSYIKKIDNESVIDIYSTDSDFIQLLDDKNTINLCNWNNSTKINYNNWYKLDKKLKGKYMSANNYALAKSIIGDSSDNIKICNNYGWIKIQKLFDLFDSLTIFNNVSELISELNILYENVKTEKPKNKNLKFIENTLEMLKNNKELINKNQSIIDLSMLETPYIYKLTYTIKDKLKTLVKFNQQDFINRLNLDIYKDETSFDKIKQKNITNCYIFYKLSVKFNKTINRLKRIIDNE